jgi:hypothetical protein
MLKNPKRHLVVRDALRFNNRQAQQKVPQYKIAVYQAHWKPEKVKGNIYNAKETVKTQSTLPRRPLPRY